MTTRIRKSLSDLRSDDSGYAFPGWLTVLAAIALILVILYLVGVNVNVG